MELIARSRWIPTQGRLLHTPRVTPNGGNVGVGVFVVATGCVMPERRELTAGNISRGIWLRLSDAGRDVLVNDSTSFVEIGGVSLCDALGFPEVLFEVVVFIPER